MADAFRQLALVLLAAGASRRLGAQKLASSLRGRPLVHHAAATFGALPFARRIAVTGADDYGLARYGFEIVRLPEQGLMSRSLAAGVAAVGRDEIKGVMIALGDMPLVTADHLERLAAGFDGSRIGSQSLGNASPPAIFGPHWLTRIEALSGDAGARALLAGAPLVAADSATLCDIDTLEDLQRL